MIIRKAKKEDFFSYIILKREEEKDISKVLNKKIKSPSSFVLKKKFNEIISSKKELILFVESENKLIAYLHGMVFKNIYNRGGWVEDIFVLNDFRKKGIATSLIKEFIKIINNKGIKKLHLSVNVKNETALKLYKKLGFEMYHYDLKKEWK
ncbi:MAG: GNAT family N-acetyltransferase [archaeon]